MNEREMLTDQEIADLGPGEVTTWAYEDMFYFAWKIEDAVTKRIATQSGQRAGERVCRHCGWMCRPNDTQMKPW